jgi:mRNA-degrading endonuclease toxin of MazEF toxin-antitoxin module
MKRGEIWVVGLDPTRGHEQRGRRPVLIVSPEKFNRITKVPVPSSAYPPSLFFRGLSVRRIRLGSSPSLP